MAVIVLEVPVGDLPTESRLLPASAPPWRFVIDHLVYYCSKFDPLPAIRLLVTPEGLQVTGGHVYVDVARRLGRQRIRAIIDPESDPREVDALGRSANVDEVDWRSEETERVSVRAHLRLHVVFFGRPLDDSEPNDFFSLVEQYHDGLWETRRTRPFDGSVMPSAAYHSELAVAELEAWSPTDEAWFGSWVETLMKFDRDVAPIASYQGQVFP